MKLFPCNSTTSHSAFTRTRGPTTTVIRPASARAPQNASEARLRPGKSASWDLGSLPARIVASAATATLENISRGYRHQQGQLQQGDRRTISELHTEREGNRDRAPGNKGIDELQALQRELDAQREGLEVGVRRVVLAQLLHSCCVKIHCTHICPAGQPGLMQLVTSVFPCS